MTATDRLLGKVKTFLNETPVGLFIGGRFVPSADGATFTTLDPGDGSPLATVYEAKAADVDAAVRSAEDAFKRSGWATQSAKERAAHLHKLADLVDKHLPELAQLESLDVGKPLAQAQGGDIPNVAQTLRWYADFATHVHNSSDLKIDGFDARQVRKPWGVCAFILPWNFPMLLVGWNIAPALAAGNTVVIKPAEDTPLSTLYFCKLVQEAGIPPGVINVIAGYGESAGKALAEHPRIRHMGFTGSPEVGRQIASACGANLVPVKLELGGKGAAVVFDDVDVDTTADQLVAALTLNTGQVCCTATRWVLHEAIWNDFLSAVTDRLQAIRIGHGLEDGTQMGPAVNEKQRRRILGYLEGGVAQGARPILEGGPTKVPNHPGGFYVKPALLTGEPDNICAVEEIFGPVAYLMPFKDEDEAVALANHTAYGLANSVWTPDLKRADRVAEAMEAGNSWINGHNLFPHGVPYAGCNLSGCGGGVLGPDTLFDYLRPQSVVRPLQ